MVCMKSCIIATMFIVAMVFTMYKTDSVSSIQKLTRVLSEKQNAIYKKIADERRKIYFTGFGLGLVLSFLFLFWKSATKNSYKINRFSTICVVGAITFMTNYFYYMLSPKSDWMILHVDGDPLTQLDFLEIRRVGAVGAFGPRAGVDIVVEHAGHALLRQSAQILDVGNDRHDRC